MTRPTLAPLPEIFDYDPTTAGVVADDRYALARACPAPAPEPDALPIRRETYIPALPARTLPALPTAALSAEADDANFALASAQALAAGAGGVFEHTSAADRTRADLWRSGGYAVFGVVTGFGVVLVTMAGQPLGWFFAAVGAFGLIAMMGVHVASLRHSQAGVARMKVTTIRGMARDRLDSRERLAREMTSAWVALAGAQMEHEERMEDRRHGRK